MVIVLLLALVALGFAAGSTEIVEGRIVTVTDRGYVLGDGNREIEVVASVKARYWRNRAPSDFTAFHEGDRVMARIAKSKKGARLAEIADPETWKWLADIGAHPQAGVVVEVGPKSLELEFTDRTRFTYRATAKSKVSLTGRLGAVLTDLKPGDSVYAKGRGSADGDILLVEVADTPLPDPHRKPAKPAPPPRGTPDGTLGGKIAACWPQYRMFDLAQGDKIAHISYNRQTKFTLDDRPASAKSLRSQLHAVVSYRTDKSGKIVASRVELSTHLGRMVRTGVGKRASASSEELFP
ncbi:MAG TPA: hypothetical protein VHE55_04025 [Fimbriimonadaceae bacterium]|nr:hypothetical protein [Fimbriimonadaceae bacterium]